MLGSDIGITNHIEITKNNFVIDGMGHTIRADRGYNKTGALYVKGNGFNIVNCNFKGIVSENNSVVYVKGNDCTITNCNFTNCYSLEVNGGAISIEGNNCSISNCSFKECHIDINRFTFVHHYYSGGAINVKGDNFNLTDCSFGGCSAYEGGAVCIYGTNCSLSDCVFTNCVAFYRGIVLIDGDTFNLTDCYFNYCNCKLGHKWGMYFMGCKLSVFNNFEFERNKYIDHDYDSLIIIGSEFGNNCTFVDYLKKRI